MKGRLSPITTIWIGCCTCLNPTTITDGGQDCFHLEIPLQVPTHLGKITFDELIALRARSDFRQQLAEFHQALDALLAMLGSGYAEPAMLTHFEPAQQGSTNCWGARPTACR